MLQVEAVDLIQQEEAVAPIQQEEAVVPTEVPEAQEVHLAEVIEVQVADGAVVLQCEAQEVLHLEEVLHLAEALQEDHLVANKILKKN